jgi:hypothetical protein
MRYFANFLIVITYLKNPLIKTGYEIKIQLYPFKCHVNVPVK